MDKVTLLTVSRVDRQVAAMAPVSNILSQATPAFILDERFQKAISALTVTLYFQTRFLAATTLYAPNLGCPGLLCNHLWCNHVEEAPRWYLGLCSGAATAQKDV
ncbi:hypothetical protein V2G26_010104 [Clonostachys chloroleuca]